MKITMLKSAGTLFLGFASITDHIIIYYRSKDTRRQGEEDDSSQYCLKALSFTLSDPLGPRKMKSEMDMSFAFVGDSDIEYWPSEVLPALDGTVPVAAVSGHSGASLSETLPHLRKVLENHGSIQKLMIVACAGENDIGNGISLDNSLIALRQFLDAIFNNEKAPLKLHFIFLGPKFERWL
jgi:hypothetical protein